MKTEALLKYLDEKFKAADKKFKGLHDKLEGFEFRMNEMFETHSQETDRQFEEVRATIAGAEARMVSKEYLDKKLGEFRGEEVIVARAKRPHRPTA